MSDTTNLDANTDRYRNLGDSISMSDSSTKTTMYPKFCDQPTLTHQYQNTHANNFNQIKIYMYQGSIIHSSDSKFQPADTKKDKDNDKQK